MVDEFIWRAASNVDSSSCRAKFLNFRKSHPSLNGELAQAKPAIPQHEFLSSVLAQWWVSEAYPLHACCPPEPKRNAMGVIAEFQTKVSAAP